MLTLLEGTQDQTNIGKPCHISQGPLLEANRKLIQLVLATPSSANHMSTHYSGIAANGLSFMNFHLPHTKTWGKGEDVNLHAYAAPPPLSNTTWNQIVLFLHPLCSSHLKQVIANGHQWGGHGSWHSATQYGRRMAYHKSRVMVLNWRHYTPFVIGGS